MRYDRDVSIFGEEWLFITLYFLFIFGGGGVVAGRSFFFFAVFMQWDVPRPGHRERDGVRKEVFCCAQVSLKVQ